jgi:hypothetical protein
VLVCDEVKINNVDIYCEHVGRKGKDYETKLTMEIFRCDFAYETDLVYRPTFTPFSKAKVRVVYFLQFVSFGL